MSIQRVWNDKIFRHRKLECFIADEVELSSFRDEMASMEHPFFALKSGDLKLREYKNGKVTITIKPSTDGLATIFDKDIWIYSISKLKNSMHQQSFFNRHITFTPYDFFMTTHRNSGGKNYLLLEKSLSRLKGTVIKTNILYSPNKQEKMEFSLIDSWKISDSGRVEITLPDWLYQALQRKKILKINSDYFRIRKAIDRRIYEIVRKHCGNQKQFIISIDKLYLKVGSSSTKSEFKRMLKKLINLNHLPDYTINYYLYNSDYIIFHNRFSNIYNP